jgi:magnesium chelatase subunit H
MGAYRMDAPAKGPLALLKRLRGSTRPKPGGSANSGAGQMRMLRRLPKILRFILGTAQDVRAYFLTLQYWLAGSDDNVVAMVCSLIDRYAAGPREPRRGNARRATPRLSRTRRLSPAHHAAHVESLALLPPAKARAARSGCCCCAPTCWATMPGITTA